MNTNKVVANDKNKRNDDAFTTDYKNMFDSESSGSDPSDMFANLEQPRESRGSERPGVQKRQSRVSPDNQIEESKYRASALSSRSEVPTKINRSMDPPEK